MLHFSFRRNFILQQFLLNRYYYFSTFRKNIEKEDYTDYFLLLGLDKNADQDQVRVAFINLCKRFHPDSGSPEADTTKFHKIETAYRKLQTKFADERYNKNKHLGEYGLYYKEKKSKEEQGQEYDIKHTAPQHRHYLSYDGHGYGTPSQRQKQYQFHRAQQAAENVQEHRVSRLESNKSSTETTLVTKDKIHSRKIKVQNEIERLVEDLIQASMARGDFDNLKGSGKPLPQHNVNPYVDFVTHKMNEVLIENGFTPEWILLQKEIKIDRERISAQLETIRSCFPSTPLNRNDDHRWQQAVEQLRQEETRINKKINHFNLVVPLMNKQMFLFNLNSKAENILQNGKSNNNNNNNIGSEYSSSSSANVANTTTFFGLIDMIFYSKKK